MKIENANEITNINIIDELSEYNENDVEFLSDFIEPIGNGIELNGNGFSDGCGNGYNMENLMKKIEF